MTAKPFLKLKNGEILNVGDIKKTIQGELTIQKFSYGFDLASRTSIINHLIHKNKLNNYLEIGVRDGRNYEKIVAKNKTGVDPYPTKNVTGLCKLTSDEFFKINKMKFDLIFIDGLHLEYQVDKDIEECLKILSNGGFIVMHDCNPPTEFHQREDYEVNGKFPPWNGTVWKSYAKLRMKSVNLNLSCVDCDWGVGIISKKKQANFELSGNLDFNFLDKNREGLLNLISVINFIKNY
tara:strand:+ start:2032 stop:2739 length:708 start_codon:yes stop_codon:yes gene_type:complete